MSAIDIDALLQEVEPAAPCGPNLEYDPAFIELEQAVLGKPEVQYGTTITPAAPPEWKLVKRLATDLLGRSRDLRLAVHLLRANLALYGIGGLADSLRLIERLLAERWDSVHPELDADDDMDPMLRINSLAVLADSSTVLKDLKEVAFLTLPGLGPLTLRVLDISSGELAPAKGQEKLAASSIEAALVDIDDASLSAVIGDFSRAHGSAVEIEVILVRRVGNAQTINLDGLTRALKRGRDFLMPQLAGRKGQDAPETAPEDSIMSDAPTQQSATVSTTDAANPTPCQHRDDQSRRRAPRVGQTPEVLPGVRAVEPGTFATYPGETVSFKKFSGNPGRPGTRRARGHGDPHGKAERNVDRTPDPHLLFMEN